MRIDLHIHFEPDPEVLDRLEALAQNMNLVLSNTESIMPTLQELQDKADATLASITAETDIDNAVAKVVNDQRQTIVDLKAQLAAAGTDPAKLQALSDTLDNILTLNTSNTKIVSDAVTAGTPAA